MNLFKGKEWRNEMARKAPIKESTDSFDNENMDKVTNLWSDFSEQMESKLRELFETSAAEYRDIYQNWTDLSERMGKQMLGFTIGDETIYKNIYDSWREYSEKLNLDLGKVSKADDKLYSEFSDFWTNYSEKFTNQLSDLMREGIKEQYELYELWMDTFARNASEGSISGDIPSIMNQYWLDIFNRFNDFYSQKGLEVTPHHVESGEHIYKQYEEIYNYWIETSQKMLDDVMRSPAYGNFLAQSIASSMDSRQKIEDIWTQNLKILGLSTKSDLEEIREELKNLYDKLDRIEKAVVTKSKGK